MQLCFICHEYTCLHFLRCFASPSWEEVFSLLTFIRPGIVMVRLGLFSVWLLAISIWLLFTVLQFSNGQRAQAVVLLCPREFVSVVWIIFLQPTLSPWPFAYRAPWFLILCVAFHTVFRIYSEVMCVHVSLIMASAVHNANVEIVLGLKYLSFIRWFYLWEDTNISILTNYLLDAHWLVLPFTGQPQYIAVLGCHKVIPRHSCPVFVVLNFCRIVKKKHLVTYKVFGMRLALPVLYQYGPAKADVHPRTFCPLGVSLGARDVCIVSYTRVYWSM